MYEVEQKFRVHDLQAIKTAFLQLGAEVESPETQIDRYFAHPARDFVETDEAFRLRQIGDELFATYKGPRLKGAAKTRREIELPLANRNDSLAEFTELFTALGFRMAADVAKQREQLRLTWRDRQFVIALDQVQTVGEFVEIETLADESDLPSAQAAVIDLAKFVELKDSTRESYLELVLREG